MKFKKKLIFIILNIILIGNLFLTGAEALNNNRNIIYKNINMNYCDTLNIRVEDINLKDESICLGEYYNGMAIITLEVKNNDVVDMELSNIDINPYQNESLTECFVTTESGEVTGMIGNLQRGESKYVKIGVALENLKDPVKLEFKNIDQYQNYKFIENIDIK
ncbi:hypothetical protein [Paraclostridium bifermentans]|uniref:hypothetical protein n=1 Tax=Paraclostridium bifermentans TaxID=1490 RepID=UPI00359CA396